MAYLKLWAAKAAIVSMVDQLVDRAIGPKISGASTLVGGVLLICIGLGVLAGGPVLVACVSIGCGTLLVLLGLKQEYFRSPGRIEEQSQENLEALEDAQWQIVDSQVRHRDLLDAQDDLIIRRTRDGRLIFANKSFCRAVGKDRDALLDTYFEPEVLQVEATESGGRSGSTTELMRLSNGERWITWDRHIVAGLTGPSEIQLVGRDITDERRLIAELSKARVQAEAASRAKSRFLASMSHEIRTPMNGILGMASLLRTSNPAPEQDEYIEAVEISARALLGIIDEVLDFSKIEAGKIRFDEQPFELSDCVGNVVNLMTPRAREKGIALRWHVDPELDSVLSGDENRVRQILLNLVSNAVKFTDSGHVAIRVDDEGYDGTSRRISIVVKDTGVGMDADTLRRLFTEFEQGSASVSSGSGGSGLGLAISQKLARAMGGDLIAKSDVGCGTEMIASLTFSEVRPSVDELPEVHEASVAREVTPGVDRPRILIVEDNAINAKLARKVVERAGGYAVWVGNGELAVEQMERVQSGNMPAFDLILMDVSMPVMDGLEACRRIRAMFFDPPDSGGKLPIIALTANAYQENRQACVDAGMSDYLAKPFDVPQLSVVLRKWVPRMAGLDDSEPRRHSM